MDTLSLISAYYLLHRVQSPLNVREKLLDYSSVEKQETNYFKICKQSQPESFPVPIEVEGAISFHASKFWIKSGEAGNKSSLKAKAENGKINGSLCQGATELRKLFI